MEQMKAQKISVITVVLNDAEHIRHTIESYLHQTLENKEYIVIDGGSTDGTLDIISEYAERIDFLCSEKDNGLYDAMNKGIKQCSGEWINILNSGDVFASDDALKEVIDAVGDTDADIIYGDSIERNDLFEKFVAASDNINKMRYFPAYRHGSSLVRASLHKANLFPLEKSKKFGYGLDWYLIHQLYQKGCKFAYSHTTIQKYIADGISGNQIRNFKYNYRITSNGKFNLKKYLIYLKACISCKLKHTILYDILRAIALDYIPNSILPHIPFWSIRKAYFRCIGMKIGKGSFIMRTVYVMNPNKITIGKYSHINRGCMLDGRGGITIGDSVSVSHKVNIITGGHDANDQHFIGIFKPIKIDDYAWIGIGATILQGTNIGKGVVIGAGSMVTKDIDEYTLSAGVPAKPIGKRRTDLSYKCKGWQPLT
ncbi:MAG: glycosyltransferase [Prevotellaceae bacterium]|nr:glycosyltransferase [Prevotellaceae bacterium]